MMGKGRSNQKRLELPDPLKYDTKETDFNPSFLLFVLLIPLFFTRLIRKRKTTAAKVRNKQLLGKLRFERWF